MWALDHDPVAWEITEGLTTEVGARQGGTEAEARGRAWALGYLRKAGFAGCASTVEVMRKWIGRYQELRLLPVFG